MYPNQNQYSIDYLNEIAPAPKKPGLSNKLFLVLIGAGVLIVLAVGLALLSSSGSGNTKNLQILAARLQTLQTISSAAQANIKSSNLRGTNSDLSILLTNANRDIETPLKNNGIDPKNLDKTIVTSEKGTELSAKLEDARLNAVFDQTYSREMDYQLATVAALMKDIYTSMNSKSLKSFLVATDANLQPIKQLLADFNSTSS